MSERRETEGQDATALVRELFTAAMELTPRSIFEQRDLITQALQEIGKWRANRDFDPVFDGDRSALKMVEQIHHAIASEEDHHIRAAMLVAAELLDMLQPSPISPLGRALHERIRHTLAGKGEGVDH